MTPDTIVAAFALTNVPERPTRIHKVDLIDAGAATAADRKLIEAAIDRLDWIATLSPVTIGVEAGQLVPAIQLLTLRLRSEPTQRLLTIIHRAIPLPLVLITGFGDTLRISLAPLRPAERIEGAMVVERLVATPILRLDDPATVAFLASLALSKLPRTDLAALYDGLIWRVEALIAAQASGTGFRLPADTAEAQTRRNALAEHDAISVEFAKARAAARAEKQLARQVALAEAARLVKARLDELVIALK